MKIERSCPHSVRCLGLALTLAPSLFHTWAKVTFGDLLASFADPDGDAADPADDPGFQVCLFSFVSC